MFLPKNASRRQIAEAENARKNRMEIVKALSHGQITKRDLFRWGLLTSAGTMVMKNGLSQYASSAYAAIPTGTPLSPLFGAGKWQQEMPRLHNQPRLQLKGRKARDYAANWKPGDPNPGELVTNPNELVYDWYKDGQLTNELAAKNLSYHEDFTKKGAYKNPATGVGPAEGRPDTAVFGHQRWDELQPEVGFILSLGQIAPNTKFHPGMPDQNPNSVWSFGTRTAGVACDKNGQRFGLGTCPLVKLRYGEPVVTRIYNDLPDDVTANEGFGRNEISTHFHNAHNGAESDGACNAYHFPGTFYDYHWGTTMARRDMVLKDGGTTLPAHSGGALTNVSGNLSNIPGWQQRCSGPTGDPVPGAARGPNKQVVGDFREIQGTLWFHDHRFFFTAENVHKGNFSMCNMYSGPDAGTDQRDTEMPDSSSVNLCLPSGNKLPWGNCDFDVNITVTNPAFKSGAEGGQLFFDIFDTDGFLGDMLLVNGAYYPVMKVLPRRYRFRFLNASMSRFIKLALAVASARSVASGSRVPFWYIANDGNFVPRPILMATGEMDEQGVAERNDIVIDFSKFQVGDSLFLVNTLQQTNGRKPDGAVSMSTALNGTSQDPCVGPILKFQIVDQVESVDAPGQFWYATDKDDSVDFAKNPGKKLTEQIPIVAPKRTRTIEWVRASGDSRKNPGGVCIPECGDIVQFPWSVKVDGKASHSLNGNRISELIHEPGEVEHWTYVNGGGGWDHPIHLHFEEGVTMNRGNAAIPATELGVRKDVWRLRPSGSVTFQVRFGEFGGAYVNHCHNTVHEDFAMLLRYQLLRPGSTTHADITKTPIPSRTGCTWMTPEVLPEGDFRPKTAASTTSTTTSTPTSTANTTTSTTTTSSSGSGKGKGKG